MKITLIIGLPCSGKTWLANKLSLGFIPVIDDCSIKDCKYVSYNFKFENLKCKSVEYKIEDVKNGCIITYPWLCIKNKLNEEIDWINKLFQKENPRFESIYFENNPNKCMKNLEYRIRNGDPRNVELSIKMLTARYEIPREIIPLPIWTYTTDSDW